jgi:hypothetical protein
MTIAEFDYPVFRLFGFSAPEDFMIIWLSNLLTLNVSDKGKFKKRVVRTRIDIYKFIASYLTF